MSVAVMTLVFSRRFGSANRKAVALKLADWADDDGSRVFPSLNRVAAECEMSERTVRRIVRQFESEGILTPVVNGGKGPGHTNHWIMNLGAIEDLPITRSKADTMTALRRSPTTEKAVNHDRRGGHGDPQSIKEPIWNHQSRAGGRPRKLSNGEWEIPKGSLEFEAWHERHIRTCDYSFAGECEYCPDGGAIERRSRWPPRSR